MITKFSIAEPFGNAPKRSNICPECGDVQVFKWDSVDNGRNITLISSSHEECKVIIEEKKLNKVA
jgi:hypothetical protein